MSASPLAQFRWLLAAVLLVVVAFALWPRGSEPQDAGVSPMPSVVVGELAGEVLGSGPSPAASDGATPVPTASPAVSPTPQPTATPATADGFGAEVLACSSISGDSCNGQLGTLPANAGTFTALVRFTDANAGDQMNATLAGPSGTIGGFPYTLQGGGDGYYYSQFQAGSLPAGEYTLTATRNGEVVATTSFTKAD